MSGWTEYLLRKGKRETEPGAASSASKRLSWPFTNTHLQTGLSQAKMREAALTYKRHLPQEQEQRAIPPMVLNGKAAVPSCCPVLVFASVQMRALKLPGSCRQYYLQMTKRLQVKTLKQFEYN